MTTGANRKYLDAMEVAFGPAIDYAMLQKLYGNDGSKSPERKYSAGECCGTIKGMVCKEPDDSHINTSYVERANLAVRMGMRWVTRLTDAFSKNVENHAHAVALHFIHYSFGRVHRTLRVTRAMEAGVADRVWTLEEIAALSS